MLADGVGIYFCGINPHEFPATSNACVVDDVAEAVERHHERRLVHVERVGDRGFGLLVRLGVDQSFLSLARTLPIAGEPRKESKD